MLIVVKTRLIGKFMTWTQRLLRDRQRRSRSNLTQDVAPQSYAEISQSGAKRRLAPKTASGFS